ncbi:SIS domain-containing protein [Daejeonella sp. H1SJ63]|uniref:D-sedoheptulose-7-phosphate isomerase n=1 Tax=Daejeonella sp. H1SJ63 TaxID=3034145 RepID=UPI0023EE2239|nr:SIS domain-containing protein [Daejeonella sp. H1SJ63]
MKKQIELDLLAAVEVHQAILNEKLIHSQLEDLALACLNALRNGGKIIFAGNGGSFADSQHLSAEFVSRLQFDRAPLASLALGTNSSSMSAIGNDYGYEEVFARELDVLGTDKDVFIPITTSGNSPNILKAISIAKRKNIKTVALTGKTGGKLLDQCESIKIPSLRTERIQEGHILLGHILCALVETAYFKN